MATTPPIKIQFDDQQIQAIQTALAKLAEIGAQLGETMTAAFTEIATVLEQIRPLLAEYDTEDADGTATDGWRTPSWYTGHATYAPDRGAVICNVRIRPTADNYWECEAGHTKIVL